MFRARTHKQPTHNQTRRPFFSKGSQRRETAPFFSGQNSNPATTIQPKGEVNDKDQQELEEVQTQTHESELESSQYSVGDTPLPPSDSNSKPTIQASKTSNEFQPNGSSTQNPTGLPSQLKAGLESLSGLDLSGIRVHSNSSKPTQIDALAYAQGQDIHLKSGQQKHLPHEGWHVVQQMQGRVKPTMQAKGTSINDDEVLEQEADVMGAAALQVGSVAQAKLEQNHQGSMSLEQSVETKVLPEVDSEARRIPQAKEQLDVSSISHHIQRKAQLDIPAGGKTVNKVGVIQWSGSPQVRLRSTPDTTSNQNILASLPFNTRLEVIKKFPNGWSFVATEQGQMGYAASTYIWTHLPEPNASLHKVESGLKGFAISIAEKYYGVDRYKFGQDLRFYVGVLAYVNKKDIPKTTEGWKKTKFNANDLIWIPSLEFARGLKGTVNSGSYTYNLAESLGLAEFLQRSGQKLSDIRNAIRLSSKYMGAAIKKHATQALVNALTALAILIVGAVAVLAVTTAIGAAIGAIFGGVGAAPGAAAGFKVGLFLLKWLGLGFLVKWIIDSLVKIGSAFVKFFGTVWNANGNAKKLEQGAQDFAEAIGTLIGVILEALIILAATWGLGKLLTALSKTKFGQKIGSKLGRWIKEKLGEPKKSKSDTGLIGSSGKKYKTKEMESGYKGEDTGVAPNWPSGTKVKYLNEAQRAALEVFVKDGKLVNSKGELIDTSGASSVFSGGGGKAIFVMDGKGRIFISLFQKIMEFHHSSILAGQPVAAAGEIAVSKGVVTTATRRSGHYKPMLTLVKQVLTELGSRGVDVSKIKITEGF